MLTTFDLDQYVYDSLRAAASGFLLKGMPGEDIVTAVRQAARGSDSLLAPAITRRLIQRFAGSRPVAPSSASQLATLTRREIDVLRDVAHGMSNAEIAVHLFIAESTVKTRIARLLMLSLRDRVQIVVFAYESGLISTAR